METALLLALAACTAAPAAPPRPTAPPAVSQVHVTLKSTVTDKLTGQLLRATVLQDGVVIFREVSYFELVLPADTRKQRAFVRVEAPGYQPWEQGYRHYWTTNKVYEFPVKLEMAVRD